MKISCLAHIIQLVVKAILSAFNIKSAEGVNDDVNNRSVKSVIAKV
jgi:hypothetical protein